MGSRRSIAVVGSGIAGLGAAWLLSRRHAVTLFETEGRPGGHSNTVETPGASGSNPVDTGFIVYNTASYPNLIALFEHLGVPTAATDMSFSVSLDSGAYEYAGSGLGTLFGQKRNLISPGHWRMITGVFRFFREAPRLAEAAADEHLTLGQYLAGAGYSRAFIDRHILPMAAAIWSTPSQDVLAFPAAAFVRFFSNHGLLQVRERPQWRTVVGGSRQYVKRVLADIDGDVRIGDGVTRIERTQDGVTLHSMKGVRRFDACVVATHADDALALLADSDSDEKNLLGSFRYCDNRAVLHRDSTHMPRRRRLWSSWNYLGAGDGVDRTLSVSYWMNRLQPLGEDAPDVFVTLNPMHRIASGATIAAFNYRHPMFDPDAMAAQRELWRLQGRRNTWFCGSYFGYGFHEDGLQAGLAAAEAIGGVRRPWDVEGESSRIHLGQLRQPSPASQLEAAE